jgi:hypothetical protein
LKFYWLLPKKTLEDGLTIILEDTKRPVSDT